MDLSKTKHTCHLLDTEPQGGNRRKESGSENTSLILEFVVILFFTIVHNRIICVAEKQLKHTHSGSRNLPI